MDPHRLDKALAAACSRFAKQPFVTVDTEFMRETTYYPRLCLIQMATADEGVLIDPLAPGLELKRAERAYTSVRAAQERR